MRCGSGSELLLMESSLRCSADCSLRDQLGVVGVEFEVDSATQEVAMSRQKVKWGSHLGLVWEP